MVAETYASRNSLGEQFRKLEALLTISSTRFASKVYRFKVLKLNNDLLSKLSQASMWLNHDRSIRWYVIRVLPS